VWGGGGGWRVRIKANIFLQFLIGQERERERGRDLNVGISREKSFQIKSHIIPFIPAAAAANTAIGTDKDHTCTVSCTLQTKTTENRSI
jgi:hypothetical protein